MSLINLGALGISIHALREESDKIHQMETLIREKFQSTLSVRRATRQPANHTIRGHISIHALREESDPKRRKNARPHTRFQSTLSVRRSTTDSTNVNESSGFQSTLSVRRATRLATSRVKSKIVSIHALREESDMVYAGQYLGRCYFNPRSP